MKILGSTGGNQFSLTGLISHNIYEYMKPFAKDDYVYDIKNQVFAFIYAIDEDVYHLCVEHNIKCYCSIILKSEEKNLRFAQKV